MMGRGLRMTVVALTFVLLILFVTGCEEPEVAAPTSAAEVPSAGEAEAASPSPPAPTAAPPLSTAVATAAAPTEPPTAEAQAVVTATTVAPEPTTEAETSASEAGAETEGLLIDDDFEDTASGWPSAQTFDNYYIGYHEPEWYHVEVQVPNEYVPVVLEGHTFDDVTAEADVFVERSLSADEGDFRYGLVLRRSGRQFYAFTIDPNTQSWAVIKSSPTSLDTLAEGSDESIQGLREADTIRVDAAGSSFAFYVDGELVAELQDADYASGELGFFVQTFDSPRVHIHYDALRVGLPRTENVILSDNFEDSSSGWPTAQTFDNYYIGYHEPEWYHVEVQVPNEYVPVVLEGESFGDVTAEADVFVEKSLSADSGDFRYGLVLRRAGRQFYAFTIDPNTQGWAVIKSSPTSLDTLAEGNDESIQGLKGPDRLRVDAMGSTFIFHVNGNVVSELRDEAYASGELGFFVQTFDSPRVHIHYDTLSVREVEAPAPDCVVMAASLNLRPGPGVRYTPPLRALPQGTHLIPIARSSFTAWIQVQVAETGETGWIYAVEPYASCNFSLSDLPTP